MGQPKRVLKASRLKGLRGPVAPQVSCAHTCVSLWGALLCTCQVCAHLCVCVHPPRACVGVWVAAWPHAVALRMEKRGDPLSPLPSPRPTWIWLPAPRTAGLEVSEQSRDVSLQDPVQTSVCPGAQAPTCDGRGPGCTFAPLSWAPWPRNNVGVQWPEPPELRILPQHLPQKVLAGGAAHARPGKRSLQGGAQKDGMPERGWMGRGEPAPPFCASRPCVALGDVGLSLRVSASPPDPRGVQVVPALPEPCSSDGV